MKKIFITGSNGFVGKVLINELEKKHLKYVAGVRSAQKECEVSYGDFCQQDNWNELIRDCEAIVHLAARVHVMNEENADPLRAFREMNCMATLRLAKDAKTSGIKKFIFISSVKVNGEETFDHPFTADQKPEPKDYYGFSKAEAELELMKLHEPGQFEVTIIRPPLIYGPGVKANFANLYKFVERDLPLPFGRADFNKRSLVSVYNLCDLIVTCLDNPAASGQVFLVSDDRDISLKELIQEMAKSLGKTAHLLPVPVSLMSAFATIIGKKHYTERLFGNLQVDITKTKQLLNWKPPYTFQDTFSRR